MGDEKDIGFWRRWDLGMNQEGTVIYDVGDEESMIKIMAMPVRTALNNTQKVNVINQ